MTLRGPILDFLPNKLLCENLYGDPRRVVQVAINLCSNAIKFSPRSGAVLVFMNVKNVFPITPELFTSSAETCKRFFATSPGAVGDQVDLVTYEHKQLNLQLVVRH